MASIAQTSIAESDKRARRAVGGAFAGFFVDMFDVYLPIIALAPAAAYFEATGASASTSAILSAMVFVAALIGRPIGAAIFGHFGDKIGRRKTAMVSVSGFGIVTLAIACLPGYHQIGVTAVILLIALRLLDGIFLGGEYTAASPLAMEYSPHDKRGYYGGLIMTGFPIAYVVISLVTLLVLQIAPAAGLDSAYVQWGWRIPFFAGALLAFAFVLFYRKYVPESDVWEGGPRTKSPMRELFSGQNVRVLGQVFLMMTGIWFTLYMVSAVLPGQLTTIVGLSASQKTFVVLVANLVLAGGYVAAGVLSQRTGRRPFFIGAGAVAAIFGSLVYALIVNLTEASFGLVMLLTILANLLVVACWGVVTTYINEAFHTGVRASGYGLGYSLAVIIPSFYAFYQAWLSNIMPAEYTALVLLVFGGILISVGAAMGPETRDVIIRKRDGVEERAVA
ncbi:MFS transporter [Nocardioides panaciterrulae]|uniref:MFS family permease n=1 Tax=Nocardioides panaciterrulae TaxID=661492 RepID=A0A7Y9JAK8_9ACTN|nr:MFS transporter [Nocardioides panaciterrulae]NYD40419.1 MFS family permease [Nocardioides panaciterrulae]